MGGSLGQTGVMVKTYPQSALVEPVGRGSDRNCGRAR